MKMNNNNNKDIKEDNFAAIGIGAMIVFISLILVAAVASAVIIQTAEKLQQNAQKTGDDTSDEMKGKIMVLSGYLDAGNNYVLIVKLAAGSDDISTDDVITQMQCGTTPVNGLAGAGFAIEELSGASGGITDGGTMENDRGYAMQIDGNGACNALTEIPLYIHIKGAGSTYELLQIDDRTDGAAII